MEECNKVQRLGESRNSMYWILYQTLNLENNKIYIGVHKTKNPYIFDGYLGNGVYISSPKSYIYAKTAFEAAVKKYGPGSFRRTTIKVFNTEDEAYAAEAEFVNEEFLARNDVYNMILGGRIPHTTKNPTSIYQYSTTGDFITEFKSFQEAAKSISVNTATLSDACQCRISCGGFYWSKTKFAKIDITEYKPIKNRIPVYAYDLEGNFLKEFPSTHSTGYTQASVSAVLGNIVDNKYRFCYVKAATYSEARNIYVKQRVIYQYDSNGKFLKSWNYLDALQHFPHDRINQAIRHKTLTASGHYWGMCKYKIYNAPVTVAHRKVAKYDLHGNLIETYNNTSECYKSNGKNAYKVLQGLRKTHKGHIYKYIE